MFRYSALVGGVAMGVGNSVGARKGEVAGQRRRMLGFTRGKQCGAIVSTRNHGSK